MKGLDGLARERLAGETEAVAEPPVNDPRDGGAGAGAWAVSVGVARTASLTPDCPFFGPPDAAGFGRPGVAVLNRAKPNVGVNESANLKTASRRLVKNQEPRFFPEGLL